LFTYRYRYMFSPSQLGFLCEQITNMSEVPGSILEVGCAYGATSVFLNRHIDTLGIDVEYYAIDTFAGFTADDISCEHALGRRYRYDKDFRGNSKAWFDRTMRRNGVRRVRSFCADATTFDYSSIAPFRFVLVDVDLYRPVLAVLEAVYQLVSPGGVIVTDDCLDEGRWAGAHAAFVEFTRPKGLDAVITGDQLGLIQKPAQP
jgi:O-methyltransferase